METRYGDVEISLADHVATAEIQRPPNNFFDTALIQSLVEAFEALDERNRLSGYRPRGGRQTFLCWGEFSQRSGRA